MPNYGSYFNPIFGGGGRGGGGGLPTPGGSSNQYGMLPPSQPGRVPQAAGGGFNPMFMNPNLEALGQGAYAVPTAFPGLSGDYAGWLRSMVGEGATPFNLQTELPSSGAFTEAGQLSAPLADIVKQLQAFYSGEETNIPGLSTLSEMAETGMPVDVMDAWQAMIEAQERNIGQGEANLREQFAFGGGLAGSPFGTAMTDYQEQAIRSQNAMLGQMTMMALESARQRQLQAGGTLAEGAQDFGTWIQSLDQEAINRMFDEFIRTRPEYAPWLSLLHSMATTYPPTVLKGKGLGGLGGLLSGGADIFSALGDVFGGGGGGSAPNPETT